MAKQPSKKSTTDKQPKSETNVTRIKATGSAKPATVKKTVAKKPTAKKVASPAVVEPTEGTAKRRNPFKAMGDYFKGAWFELRQVRWPDRKATWGMTGALLAFTAFFVVVILLLDALFKYIFQLIIG